MSAFQIQIASKDTIKSNSIMGWIKRSKAIEAQAAKHKNLGLPKKIFLLYGVINIAESTSH
jgi:hypothetical protein